MARAKAIPATATEAEINAAQAPKVEGTFGDSASARHYEERIIQRLIDWGIKDGESPDKYIRYLYTEESRSPTGMALPVSCHLCGHTIIYKQVCWQDGPGNIAAERVLGCDCVVNYSVVQPGEARLMALKTADLQKAFVAKQKEAREDVRKAAYASQFKDVLDYIRDWRKLHGERAFLPTALYDAEKVIESGAHGEKKTMQFIGSARRYMTENPLDQLAADKAAEAAQNATELARRKAEFAKHMEALDAAISKNPSNDFFRSMDEKFTRYVTDIKGWRPTPNMIAAVEKEMQRQELEKGNKGADHNMMEFEELINRVENLHNYTWGTGKTFFGGEWHNSQKEDVAALDDMVTKLVEKGGFASDKAQAFFMRKLEKYERIANGRENR